MNEGNVWVWRVFWTQKRKKISVFEKVKCPYWNSAKTQVTSRVIIVGIDRFWTTLFIQNFRWGLQPNVWKNSIWFFEVISIDGSSRSQFLLVSEKEILSAGNLFVVNFVLLTGTQCRRNVFKFYSRILVWISAEPVGMSSKWVVIFS